VKAAFWTDEKRLKNRSRANYVSCELKEVTIDIKRVDESPVEWPEIE
jgi:hypothetical protein